eukprot:5140186-Pyramimonas_sp.AAC.1
MEGHDTNSQLSYNSLFLWRLFVSSLRAEGYQSRGRVPNAWKAAQSNFRSDLKLRGRRQEGFE